MTRPLPRLIGMVHLLPLPGAPRWAGSLDLVVERAIRDALALARGGMDGILVENYADVPFLKGRVGPETCAAMTRVALEVMRALESDGFPRATLPIGVNVLRNDPGTALAVAHATGCAFIRVNVHTGVAHTDQGTLEGDAAGTLRERSRLGADAIRIAADVHVKHATPPHGETLEQAARDARDRGLADILIVSGAGTGLPTDPDRLRRVRGAVPGAPLWVGSGVTPATVRETLTLADGVIVGSALQDGGIPGSPVDPARVEALVRKATG
jgi:uncharacterized protein